MVSSSRGESVWHVSVLSNGFLKLPWLESSSAYTCRCHQLPGPSSAEAGAAERKRNGSRNEQARPSAQNPPPEPPFLPTYRQTNTKAIQSNRPPATPPNQPEKEHHTRCTTPELLANPGREEKPKNQKHKTMEMLFGERWLGG